jgi:outer membrane receptor protein involved in Fe transport
MTANRPTKSLILLCATRLFFGVPGARFRGWVHHLSQGFAVAGSIVFLLGSTPAQDHSQVIGNRTIAGIVVTQKREVVAAVSITAKYAEGEQKTTTDGEGRFSLVVPRGAVTLKVEGKNLEPAERVVAAGDAGETLEIVVSFVVPHVHESVVIVASALDPGIDRRDDAVFKGTLFSRDDQVFATLSAGINAGQHEGGGKSLEIRRFGFNLDHGGVSGGLKVLVDNVQQNQGTQGHGQGYLGQLKSLTPELVQEVSILNGPFSSEYGDFSGLGVVHIRLKESLPDVLTSRLQGGSFDTARAFVAYSPSLDRAASLVAYEVSRTDGPFQNPLRYRRDNVTANYTRNLNENEALGFKLNAGRNDFFSSGQIPLDEVAAGRLDRFGFIDPFTGGRVRSASLASYYRREWTDGTNLKVDGFVSRSLFDLFSNFTFFLADEVNGDGIQQHDSRLQEGLNVQVLHPFKVGSGRALLTAGGNFHDNQINVGLYHSVARSPIETSTSARAHVTSAAGYFQQGLELFGDKLHIDGGLRYDYFRFGVDDRVAPDLGGTGGAYRFQPKANLAYTPFRRMPLTLYADYGRGIASQDARGVVQKPDSPRLSTTDFYQVGSATHLRRLSIAADLFLIDRSNEQVYIPDDGTIEFKGPSRAYGGEFKASAQITKALAFNAGLTRVGNAFYRGTLPRIYVDSAPHFVTNAGLTLSDWRHFYASLRYRHVSNYRLDGEDAGIRASGLDVIDLNISRRLSRSLDINLAVDNVNNKRYFETQNYFESRMQPGDPVVARIHGTPGYPLTLTLGVTLRLFGK